MIHDLQISVTYSLWKQGDIDAGEPSETGIDIDREDFSLSEVIGLSRRLGINVASESSIGAATFFSSSAPSMGSEFIELGDQKIFTLHIHIIDGEEPTRETMRMVSHSIGIYA